MEYAGENFPSRPDYFGTVSQTIAVIHLGIENNDVDNDITSMRFEYQDGSISRWVFPGVIEETYAIQIQKDIKKIGLGTPTDLGDVVAGLRIKYEDHTDEFIIPYYNEHRGELTWLDSFEIGRNMQLIGVNENFNL